MDHQSFKGWGQRRTIQAHDDDVVRTYPQHQIYLEDGVFNQTRSGPNWEGGLLTLTTCKHYMRTANVDWQYTYLAGFTPKTTCGDSYLLYLARVARVFDSNYDLGNYLMDNHPEAWEAKLAVNSPFGDIYSPLHKLSDKTKYNPKHYKTPVGHTRMEHDKKFNAPKWHRDIKYEKGGRRPVTFLFDNVHLFRKPVFVATRPLHRSGYKGLIRDLKEGIKRV